MIIVGVVLLLGIGYIGWYVLNNMGKLYSDRERDIKYGNRPFYSLQEKVFISPEELVFFPERTTGGDAGFARFFMKSPNAPKSDLPINQLTRSDFKSVSLSDYALYWLGHSSAILELGGMRILIDPVLENAAPFPGIVPRYVASPIKREDLPDMDAVLITHDHYDHLEKATIQALKNSTARFICPLGVGARLEGWGIDTAHITEVGWNDIVKVGNVEIASTPCVHYSGRSKTDRNKTLWTGYAIKGSGKSIYWSGDTGYGCHFRKIGEQYGPFDLACVEIDGWNAGWPNTHLFPEQVISVCKDIKSTSLLPVHWGIFDLALHKWNESIEMVAKSAMENNIRLITPLMGERIIPDKTTTNTWWRNLQK